MSSDTNDDSATAVYGASAIAGAQHPAQNTARGETMPAQLQALRELVATLEQEAHEAHEDGDICCALTRGNDAVRIAAILDVPPSAETTAPRPNSGWQDIATAPKELDLSGLTQNIILGFAADEEGYTLPSREGCWSSTLNRWVSSIDPTWKGSSQPTHWMPLPAAPVVAQPEKSDG